MVDAVVFEKESSTSARTEALLFMMEHTEGFEFLLANLSGQLTDPNNVSAKSKNKQQSRLSSTSSTLETRRNVLLAVETITEFIEDAYRQSVTSGNESDVEVALDNDLLQLMVERLVDAFLALPLPISGT